MPFLGKFPTQIVDPEVDIDGGAIDGVTIGATTASAATVTTLTSGNITATVDSNIAAAFSSTTTTAKITLADPNDQAFIDINASRLGIGHASSAGLQALQIEPTSGEAMRIDSSGNVGIGTSSPAEVLHVANTSGAGAVGLRAENSEGHVNFTTNGGGFQFETGASGTVATIDSSGNVGIGTTSPAQKLDVNGTAVFGGATTRLSTYSDSTYSGIFNGSSLTSDEAIYMGSDSIFFYGGSSERMRINSSGRVGIGTTSPEVLTHLKSSDNTIFEIESTTPTAYMKMVDSNTTGAGYIGYVTNDMTFWANNAERMRIDSSGNVLVGKTSSLTANSRFEVATTNTSTATSAGAGAAISIQNLSTTNNTYSSIYFTNGGSGVDSAIYGIHEVGNGTGTGRTGSIAFATANLGGGVSERMRIGDSGQVSVFAASTVSPSMEINRTALSSGDGVMLNLECNNNSGTGNILRFTNDDPTIGSGNHVGEIQYFSDDAGAPNSGLVASFQVVSENASGNSSFTWRTGGGERMRLNSSGSLGIGTTSPYTPLNIRTSNSLGSTFTGSTRGEGVTVEQSSYTADNYVSLIEAPYAANAAPAARIGVKFNGSGSWLTLGTSNNYATGITNATMVIDPNGDVTIDGHVTISDGVYIGGTATGNHLDDYEEGTYTPIYYGSASGNTGTTYTANTGVYTKVGRTVTVWIDMTIAAQSGNSGVPYISLPFTSGSGYGTDSAGQTRFDMGAFISWQTSDNFTGTRRPTGWITNNSGVMQMYGYTTAGSGSVNQWTLNTTGRISGKIIYTAAF